MSTTPRPYTPERFQTIAPDQAEKARQIRVWTETDQCCMACGDTTNVKDFVTEDKIAVRICGDCKLIQEQMYGGVHTSMD